MSDVEQIPEQQTLSPLAKLGITLVATAAMSWFFVSWLVLKSPLTDAIGETVGSLAAVLLIVSVIGMARA
jgi:cytochrome c oxidase assembly factor CtaG